MHSRPARCFCICPPCRSNNPLTQALFDQADREQRTAALVMREQRALLHSPLTPDLYLERALPGKKRKELRPPAYAAERTGRPHPSNAATTRHGVAEWTEAFLDLECKGWKGQSGSAMASSAGTAGLFRHALAGAAALGKLERLALMLDGRPIAMLANFLASPGSFSFKTAFDENYARFSPGVLLQRENLALLSRPDIAWCDSCAAPDHPMIDSLWTERRAHRPHLRRHRRICPPHRFQFASCARTGAQSNGTCPMNQINPAFVSAAPRFRF